LFIDKNKKKYLGQNTADNFLLAMRTHKKRKGP